LHIACKNNEQNDDMNIAMYLIEHGLDIYIKNDAGHTPLHIPIKTKNHDKI